MISLPVETWTQIIHDHLEQRDWLTLSTTSTFIRPIAQAALYETVCRFRHLDYVDTHPMNRFLSRFTRSLAERPELATYVRALHIVSITRGRRLGSFKLDHCSTHPVLNNLKLFPRLRTMSITGFALEVDFFLTLCSHPYLSFVGFNRCRVAYELSEESIPHVPESAFTQMDIRDPIGGIGRWAAIVPAGLLSLGIEYGIEGHTELDVDNTVSNFNAIHMLTKLVVHIRTNLPPDIVTLLESLSQIRKLSIHCVELSPGDKTRLSSLHEDAIPLLEEFTGLADIAEILVPGRPVHTVTLVLLPKFRHDILASLERSTVSVMNLKIDKLCVENLDLFLKHAPTSTRQFSWDEADKETIISFIPALSRLPNLQRIIGSVPMPNVTNTIAERKKIVQQVADACPTIEKIDFKEDTWLLHEQGGWERYFPA